VLGVVSHDLRNPLSVVRMCVSTLLEDPHPDAPGARELLSEMSNSVDWMERLIRRRRETPEIVFGDWSLVPVAEPEILSLRYDWDGQTSIIVHNLAAKDQRISFKLERPLRRDGLIDLFGEGDISAGKDGSVSLSLAGYGCRWLRLRRSAESMVV
jgi:signal transduction histidine kinase